MEKPINVIENLVKAEVEKLYNTESWICCKCELCKLDVITYVLNRIEPYYITSDRGHIHSILDIQVPSQIRTNITVKVLEAIKLVKQRPRHT